MFILLLRADFLIQEYGMDAFLSLILIFNTSIPPINNDEGNKQFYIKKLMIIYSLISFHKVQTQSIHLNNTISYFIQ